MVAKSSGLNAPVTNVSAIQPEHFATTASDLGICAYVVEAVYFR